MASIQNLTMDDHGTYPFSTCQASAPTSGRVMILYAGVASSKHSAPTGRDAYLAMLRAALLMNINEQSQTHQAQPRYIIVSVFSLKWTLAVPASWRKIRAGYGSRTIDICFVQWFFLGTAADRANVNIKIVKFLDVSGVQHCRSGHLPVLM